jgi:hypothetical protein
MKFKHEQLERLEYSLMEDEEKRFSVRVGRIFPARYERGFEIVFESVFESVFGWVYSRVYGRVFDDLVVHRTSLFNPTKLSYSRYYASL